MFPLHQACLSEENRSARSSGLKGRLRKFWDGHCGELIRHDDQEAINLKKNQQSYTETQCFKHGLCVCKNGPRDNLHALWFERNLVSVMQKFFWSKGQDKHKEQSPERVLLESSMVVPRLCVIMRYVFHCWVGAMYSILHHLIKFV